MQPEMQVVQMQGSLMLNPQSRSVQTQGLGSSTDELQYDKSQKKGIWDAM